MNKDLKDRMYPCLRTGKNAEVKGTPIQEGQSFAFASGAAYSYQKNGSYRRLDKHKSLSKAEKKKLKKARLQARLNPPAK